MMDGQGQGTWWQQALGIVLGIAIVVFWGWVFWGKLW